MDERFESDLARGKAGEVFLLERYPPESFGGQVHPPYLRLPPLNERRWDLEEWSQYGSRLATVEVKTDSYDRAATPNMFMELRTRIAGKPGEYLGGPWRALSHGVDQFVYLYHKPGRSPSVGYWFRDLPALVTHLDAHRADYETRRVRYGRVMAVGLLVPRASLRGLCERCEYPA